MWMAYRNIYYIELTPIRLSKKKIMDCISNYYMEVYFYLPPFLPFYVCPNAHRCSLHLFSHEAKINNPTLPIICFHSMLYCVWSWCVCLCSHVVTWLGELICLKKPWKRRSWVSFLFDGSIFQSHSTCSYKKPWHKEEAVDCGGIKSFHDTTAMWEMVIKSKWTFTLS